METLLTVLFLTLTVASSMGATVSDRIAVWQWVKPDTYTLSLQITARGESEEEVLKALKAADDFLRETGLKYRGGNFSILPLREWNQREKRYIETGFTGSATYTFLLRTPLQQEEVFRALEKAKRIAPFKYSVKRVRWEVSPERRKEALQSLKERALKEVLAEGERLGRILKGKCLLKELNFNPSPLPFPFKVLKAEGVAAPSPRRSLERIKLEASFKLECGKVLK